MILSRHINGILNYFDDKHIDHMINTIKAKQFSIDQQSYIHNLFQRANYSEDFVNEHNHDKKPIPHSIYKGLTTTLFQDIL